MFLQSNTVLEIGRSFEPTRAEITSPKGSSAEVNVALEWSQKNVFKLIGDFFICIEMSSEVKTDNLVWVSLT